MIFFSTNDTLVNILGNSEEENAGQYKDGLPTYTAQDVMLRDGSDLENKESESSRVWISYKEGMSSMPAHRYLYKLCR